MTGEIIRFKEPHSLAGLAGKNAPKGQKGRQDAGSSAGL
jgi:hypothetical protein